MYKYKTVYMEKIDQTASNFTQLLCSIFLLYDIFLNKKSREKKKLYMNISISPIYQHNINRNIYFEENEKY